MQRSELTFCVNCAHKFQVNKSDPPWRWLCMKHPRMEGMGFVTPYSWDNADPYLLCRDVNGGACVLYQPADPRQLNLIETERKE